MDHYFTNNNISSNIRENSVIINNKKYIFLTDNGVFSKKGLDFGTRSLLETIELSKIKGKVLDFGCGYGPIGIYIKDNTDCSIDMVDINKRSIHLAQENAKINKVEVNIFESNIYSNVIEKYDFIITNPPIRVGKKILYQILFGAKEHLNINGELWLVVSKNQGAKSLLKDLAKEYDVQLVNKNKIFYIIRAINHWQLVFILLELYIGGLYKRCTAYCCYNSL